MQPRLHSEDLFPEAITDTSLRINSSYLGTLEKITSCQVTEERNGEYTLSMSLAISDECSDMIIPQRWICAKPNPFDEDQFFQIESVKRSNTSGIIEISCKHIKTIACNRAAEGDINTVDSVSYISGNPVQLWDELMSDYLAGRHVYPMKFNFSAKTSPTSSTNPFSTKKLNLGVNTPCRIGDILGGVQGSFLDLFGGEYHYNNLDITLYKNRGSEKPYRIRYGQNLGTTTQEINCSNSFSHILPYGTVPTKNAQGEISQSMNIYGIGDIQYNSAIPVSYFIPLSEVDATLSEAKTYLYDVSKYLASENVGYRQANIDAVYLYIKNLTEDYVKQSLIPYLSSDIQIETRSELDEMNELALCDTVTVILDKFGITTKAQITKTVYNPVLERYEKIFIGKETSKLADLILGNKK